MTTREFNRLMRAMGREALESEGALAVVYERGLSAAGRFYAEQFSTQTVVADANWIPPAGSPEFDSAGALAAATRQREEAARAIEESFRRGVTDIAISFDPADFTMFSDDLLVSLGQHAGANFDATARDALGQVVRESFDKGLSVPDTAKAIRGRFVEVSRSTATMLARTDLIGLANGGGYMSARKVFEKRKDVQKVWLNTHDARTRPSHVEAGGQEVPMEGPFRVGGFDLMYPGDPQGPPGEVINCRCTFTVADGAVSAAGATREVEMATTATGSRWRSILVLEGVETDDGRLIDPGALDWRDLPLSLMAMDETGPGGHEGARIAGRIDQIARNSATGEVVGEGVFDSGEWGRETERLVDEDLITGVSVDLAIREYELRSSRTGQEVDPYSEDLEEDDRLIFAVTDASIMGATVCPFPAFADATIELLAGGSMARVVARLEIVADDAPPLTAAAAPLRPPASWFEDPALDAPTALQVTEDGRVFGHAALWDSCHTANPHGAGVCVTPPHSPSGYAYFHLGSVETEEGAHVNVGQITLDAPHAPLRDGIDAASRHYDHTGVCAADVRCGEDVFGIWVAGALRPGVDEEKIRALSAAKLSGDWRSLRGRLELIGLLAVNVPGFLVPRVEVRVASGAAAVDLDDDRLALLASGIVEESSQVLSPEALARTTRALTARARGGISGLAALARGQ